MILLCENSRINECNTNFANLLKSVLIIFGKDSIMGRSYTV